VIYVGSDWWDVKISRERKAIRSFILAGVTAYLLTVTAMLQHGIWRLITTTMIVRWK
jgi:hypothetical protein